jgi:arabinose-5-phosphate isomerase
MPDVELARKVLQTEAAGILALVDRLDDRFLRAVELVRDCRGTVILTGMGKSGIICRKIAATLASTGTPAFFLHPAEAVHGDLGVIRSDDVVIALSYSGETEELSRVLETIKRLGARLVALTGEGTSTLAQAADVTLDCRVSEEACPLNLVPTASTTAMLAMGDALAMTVLAEKGFKPEDFATLHPGGALGTSSANTARMSKRLLRVGQLMHSGDALPFVRPTTAMSQVIETISSRRLGMTAVVGEDGRLAGIITDGDLRRKMADTANLLSLVASDVMTPQPITASATMLAVEALAILERRRITSILITDDNRRVLGVVHLHDLWRTQMV